MSISFFNNRISVFLFIILIILGYSCVPLKKSRYLQDIPKEDTTSYFKSKEKRYMIKPGDNLYIRITSLDDKTSKLFNPEGTQQFSGSDPSSAYLYGYSVDKDGNIQLPIIGNMNVSGQSIEGLKAKIQDAVDEYLKESVVIVKLANIQITLLGEVNQPGPQWVSAEKINILEALALAGDLTNVANGKNVKLIRNSDNGSKIYTIDVTDKKIIESAFYYLEPYDIIYVEPVKGKNFIFTQFPYGLVFATISTVLFLVTYFK